MKRSRASRSSRPRRRKRYQLNIRRLVLSGLLLLLLVECGVAAFTSPWFNIKEIEPVGNEIVSSEDVIRKLDIEPGSNIFRISKRRMSNSLKTLPPVERVRIYRKLPDTLVVAVEERQPDLVLNTGENLYEVDSARIPFRTVEQPGPDLSVISLSMPIDVKLGKPLEGSSFEIARDCLYMAREKKNLMVAEISIDQNNDLCLNVRDGFQVKLGRPEQLSEKLDKASIAVDEMPGFRQYGKYIDVTSPEAPAVKFKE